MDTQNYLGYLKLLLAINKPDYEECWINGYEHALHQTLNSNPFALNTEEHRYWSEGWWSGFYTKTCHNDKSDKLEPTAQQIFNEPELQHLNKLQTSKVHAQLKKSNDSKIRNKISLNES